MAEQSQKDEMNAAIRAQRARHNVARSIAPEPPPPVEEPVAPAKPKSLLTRLFHK